MIVFFFVIIVFLTIILGLLLAFAVSSLDKAVTISAQQAEKQTKAYNPAATLGHKVPVQGDPDELVREARQLAAKKAAATPRGANMRIGRLREEAGFQPTAFDGVKEDPVTAVKIATVHSWDAVRMGMVHGSAPAVVPIATAAAPAPAGPRELIPGKDYPVIEITDSMSPDEIRKARIANSKAKSAAMKAAKAAGDTGVAPAAAAPVAAAPAAAAPVQSAAAAAGVPEPEYIEISDSMSPDEVRKARIANSKMKSAYNKALKAAGVDPSAIGEPAPVAPPPVPEAPTAPAPPDPNLDAAALASVPKPDLIEITDDMSPDDVRKARIANSKANAAYKKALKAAGIDPSTVS
jgi:hypothetical protein